MTLTINIRNKKAITILKSLEETGMIQMVDERIPAHWSPKKRKRAQEFLEAYREAKLADEGKIKLQTAESLLDEL